MFRSDTDREWEKFGKEEPYFGVFTHDRFRNANLDDERRAEFFASGEGHVADVTATLGRAFGVEPPFGRVLDFGCGVGRLVIPFAARATHVTGVDVSESMLAEARRNCAERGIEHATFVRSDDALSAVEGRYDLVHSFIVLQHIPVRRGERLFAELVARLAPGGCGVLHVTFAKRRTPRQALGAAVARLPLVGRLAQAAKGRGFSAPRLEMNSYDLNRLMLTIRDGGADACFAEFTQHGADVGATLYFRRGAAETSRAPA